MPDVEIQSRTGSTALNLTALCALGLAIGAGLWCLQTPSGGPRGAHFIAGQALATVAYLGALAAIRARRVPGAACLVVILVLAAAMRGVVWINAPTLSTDFYRYIWDGRVINSGINPYQYAPADRHVRHLRDDLWRQINYKRIPTIYPPAAEIVFAGLWQLGGDRERTFRLAFTLFDFATVLLVWRLLIRTGQPQEWLLAYAWHPLVITEFAGGAHVDSAGIFFLVLAFALMPSRSDRPIAWSAVALGLSIMSKGYALLALPFLVRRYGWRYLPWVAGTCAALAAPFLGAGWSLFNGLTAYVAGWRENAGLLLLLERALAPVTARPLVAAKDAVGVLLVALAVWLLRRRLHPDGLRILSNTFVMFAAALLLGGPVTPWYVAWTVPFLCLWPVPGWVLFTGLVSVTYYARSSLPQYFELVRAAAYVIVYLVLAGDGFRRALRFRRTAPAASAPS